MSTRAQVQQLESDFADAMTRMYAVGNGLARLRTELDRAATPHSIPDAVRPAPVTAPTPRPVALPPSPVTRAPSPVAPAPSPQLTGPVAAPPAWYRREGAVTRVLAVTGAVITMAGVAMFLVLAAQRGWFGPEARVAAGAALAAVLIGLGVRSGLADQRAERAVGSAPVALVATGVATAYLDVVAVTTGYGWIPAGAGLTLAAAVAIAGLHLARVWASELLAVLVVLGAAILAPVVAQGGGWVVSAYLGILCVVGWWAGGNRTTPLLTLARVVPVTLALLVASAGSSWGGTEDLGHLVVAGVVLAATLGTSTVSVRRDPRDATSSAAVALLAVGLIASTVVLEDPARTLTLATASAVLLLAATTLGRRPIGPVAAHLVITTGAAGTVFAVLAVMAGAPTRFITTGLLLLALAGLTVAGATRSRVNLALAAGCHRTRGARLGSAPALRRHVDGHCLRRPRGRRPPLRRHGGRPPRQHPPRRGRRRGRLGDGEPAGHRSRGTPRGPRRRLGARPRGIGNGPGRSRNPDR